MTQVIDWNEVLGSDSDSDRECSLSPKDEKPNPKHKKQSVLTPLVEGRKIMGYLGITLNYPRTKQFLALNSVEQKKLYERWIHNFMHSLGQLQHGDDFKFVNEYCSSGQVHSHGYIPLHQECFVAGAISDIVKAILKHLPKKQSEFKESNYSPQYNRYRCPSVVVQYYDILNTDSLDKGSIEYWKTYLKKAQ